MILVWLVYVLFGKADKHEFILQGKAQGTTYTIKYLADDSLLHKAEVNNLFRVVDLSLSLYEPSSLINRFNREGMVVMDVHMKKVVNASIDIYRTSSGSFDITTRKLSLAWGFGPSEHGRNKNIRKALRKTGSDKLVMKGDTLLALEKGVEIDCNGIAQGYTVDLLAEFLESRDIKDYLVELGGEIRVKGTASGGRKWSIGIESPSIIAGEWRATSRSITMSGGAVTTSGSYRNFVERRGARYSHVIDPHSGKPVDNGIISVTVKAPTAMMADGWDNALFVPGLEKAFQLLAKHKDLQAYFIVADKNGNIRDTATSGFFRESE